MTIDSGWVTELYSYEYNPFVTLMLRLTIIVTVLTAVLIIGLSLKSLPSPRYTTKVMVIAAAFSVVGMAASLIFAMMVSPEATRMVDLNPVVSQAVKDKAPNATVRASEKLLVEEGVPASVPLEYAVDDKKCAGDMKYDGSRARVSMECR